jgi:hypothetical protein
MQLLKSALRIGIAVAMINAAFHVGTAYWSFYQFQDAAQQLAIHGHHTAPEVLKSTAFSKAAELLIPITEEQIVVSRDGALTQIEAAYQHPVEYFPHRTYPLKLAFKVEGRTYATGTAQ